MNKNRKYQFYVIQFTNEQLKKNNNKLYKHVCIPASWIGFGSDVINEKVTIKYPTEDSTVTIKLVENKTHFNETWPIYENVTLKYGTDSFQDAMDYANVLNKGLEEINGNGSMSKQDEIHHTESPQSQVPDRDHIIERTSEDLSDKLKIKAREHPELISEAPNLPETKTPTAKRSKRKIDHELPSSSAEISHVSQNTLNLNENRDNQENNISVNQKNNRRDNDSKSLAAEPVMVDQPHIKSTPSPELNKLLIDWHSSFETNYMMVKHLESASARNCDNVKKLISIVKEYHEFLNNTIVVPDEEENDDVVDENHDEEPHDPNEEPHDPNEEPHEEESGEQDECNDKLTEKIEESPNVVGNGTGLEFETNGDNEKDCEELSAVDREKQNKVGQSSRNNTKIYLTDSDEADQGLEENINFRKVNRFSLPREYDENDSRWTLRYRAPDDFLVELGNSGIYVHNTGLRYCERSSNDVKSFAQNLLKQIFSDSALRTCTLIGKNVNEFKSKKIRPGLDENAIDTLITYANKFAREKGWTVLDKHLIMGALHTKLLELRDILCYEYYKLY